MTSAFRFRAAIEVVGLLALLLDSSCSSPQSDENGPTVSLSVAPILVAAGEPVMLTWSSTNATGCSGSDSWSSSLSSAGSTQVTSPRLPGYYTYTISCRGAGSSIAKKSVDLTVHGALAPVTGGDPAAGVATVAWYEPIIYVAPPNYIVGLTTNTLVPPVDNTSTAADQDWNYWPGINPAPASYGTINNGVLQPVLTFYAPFSNWTALSVYDNDATAAGTSNISIVEGYQTSYFDQIDGDDSSDGNHSFVPNPGDSIAMSIALDQQSQNWTVVTRDLTLANENRLIVNLHGQRQNYAYFALEIHNNMPVTYSPIFTDTVISFAQRDTTGICSDASGRANNYTMTPPQLDSTGTKCSISQIIAPHP